MADDEFELFSTEGMRVPKPPPPPFGPDEVAEIGLLTGLRLERATKAPIRAVKYRNSRVKAIPGRPLDTAADVDGWDLIEVG